MKLSIKNAALVVELNRKESVLAIKRNIVVPLKNIRKVHRKVPKTVWKELRMPGTFFPEIIKAGTYYTPRGKEFWYLKRNDMPLVVEIKGHNYKRLVLGTQRGDH